MPPTITLEEAIDAARFLRRRVDPGRAVVVGISGIDGAGKGWIAERLVASLRRDGLRVAPIGIDGWLNLPHVRFAADDPGGHFYRNAVRFEALASELIRPLRDRRSVDVTAPFVREAATTFVPHRWVFDDVDVVVVEGIFLFARERRHLFDFTVWVDCTYDTARERAIARAQEGLSPEDTARAYETIYFPAQAVHDRIDAPRAVAHAVIVNDPRLPSSCSKGRNTGASTPCPSRA